MVKIGKFSCLNRQKILVVGDLLLDTYTIGKARRISPEAPVAVVHVQQQEERPGGAGNAILNLVSMGAEVVALGRVGADHAGTSLKQALKIENVQIEGILTDISFQTPVKNRVVADNQQIVRIDYEVISPSSLELEDQIIQLLPTLLDGIKVMAISDYGKGFLTPSLLRKLISAAQQKGVFIIADPKGNDFSKYRGVNLIKPNLSEAYAAARLSAQHSLDEASKIILENVQADFLMVTRSEDGISLFSAKEPRIDFPVKAKQVKDVTGAGDTVLAMLALAIANDLSLPDAIGLSNIAAGIAIEQFGCARITLPQLARRLLESDVSNKIFDLEHLQALKAALENTPCLLVSLSGYLPPTPEVIGKLTKHKRETGHSILVAIEGPTLTSTIDMIASLQPIDFILLDTPLTEIQKNFKSLTTLAL